MSRETRAPSSATWRQRSGSDGARSDDPRPAADVGEDRTGGAPCRAKWHRAYRPTWWSMASASLSPCASTATCAVALAPSTVPERSQRKSSGSAQRLRPTIIALVRLHATSSRLPPSICPCSRHPKRVLDFSTIEVGRHGLIVEQGRHRGLLLPQVAVEHGWDRDTFLRHTCLKAGLRATAWQHGALVMRFEAEVFGEQIS